MTQFICEYELKDTTAIADSTLITTSNQPFSNIAKLKQDISFADYATLEMDYFLLDGNMPEFPDAPTDIVYFSKVQSGTHGTFAENPSLSVTFTKNHTSCGLTFHFVGDHPLEMMVRWMDLSGVLICQESFTITDNLYFAKRQIENYGGLEVEFTKAKPHRYVKLRYLEYGTDLLLGSGGFPVKDARLVEEVDPISDKLAVSKLDYKLIDEDNTFDIGNQSGLHKVLQAGQIMRAYEKVDTDKILLGKFFLSDSSTDKNVTSMSCVDYRGLLDSAKFYGGKVYNSDPAGLVIDEVMRAAGITEYTVDAETRKTPLYGWLKIQTCRKALREILFAAGSVLDSSRSLSLNIYKPGRVIQNTIGRDRKFSTAAESKEYITDVTVKFPEYTETMEKKEIAKGSYPAGIHTVEFSTPVTELSINIGIIVERATNFVTFELSKAAEVIISGKKYSKEELSVTASVKDTQAGEIRAAKDYSCTLLNASGAAGVADSLLAYHSLQLGIKVRFLNHGDQPGSWSEVYNPQREYGNYVAGIEKMTTDLTGGFISTAELRGYYKLCTDYDYTGELLSGGMGIS